MIRRLFVSVIVILALFIFPAVLLAQSGDIPPIPIDTPSLVEVLGMFAGGAGTGFVLAFLFEKFPKFTELPKKKKAWIVFGCSIGLPLLAEIALQLVPPDVWLRIEPYWQALAKGFLTWAASQAAYKGIIKPRKWGELEALPEPVIEERTIGE